MFNELLVVELASVLAGPLTGSFFAEMGAEVVKIENPLTNGDVTRSWRLPSENEENQSAYYSAANYGKKVLNLNLKQEPDYKKLITLLKKADVVIANYRPSTAKKLKLDFKTLKAINPKLIYGNIIGYAHKPNRPAFDVVLQAESGFMFMNGQPESLPTKMPVALIDVLAAHQLKQGLLTALWQRECTGNGCQVSVSLFETALASLANQASNWLMAGHIPKRMGSLHPNIAPYGEMFKTADEHWVVLAVGNNAQFRQLCSCLGQQSIANQQDYANNQLRVQNRISLYDELKPLFTKFEAEQLMETFLNKNIPAGIVKNMQQVFEEEAAQNLVLTQKVNGQITKRVKSTVFHIS